MRREYRFFNQLTSLAALKRRSSPLQVLFLGSISHTRETPLSELDKSLHPVAPRKLVQVFLAKFYSSLSEESGLILADHTQKKQEEKKNISNLMMLNGFKESSAERMAPNV